MAKVDDQLCTATALRARMWLTALTAAIATVTAMHAKQMKAIRRLCRRVNIERFLDRHTFHLALASAAAAASITFPGISTGV